MFIGTSVSTSPTLAVVAGEDIEKGAGKAVKLDASGAVVLCKTAGEAALGFLILQTADQVAKGDSVTVQITGRGQVIAGGDVAPGDLLSVDDQGRVVKATASTPDAEGGYLAAQALETGAADGMIHVVLRSGKA